MFRFPLRSVGASSEISSNAYSVERVRDFLFKSFMEEAPIILLFLKHVERISLYDDDTLLYEVSVHDYHKAMVRLERNELIKIGQSKPSFPSLRLYSMTVCVKDCLRGTSIDYHWLIFNMIGSSFKDIQDLSQKLQILPWVGIAAPLPNITNLNNIHIQHINVSQLKPLMDSIDSYVQANQIGIILPWCKEVQGHTEGRAFCFLPLPSKTYLPVNIHGYFAISDNRRSIEWPSSDNKSEKAVWNKMLLSRHIAPLYSMVIGCRSRLIKYTNTPLPINGGCIDMTDPYTAWPLTTEVKNREIWSELVKPVVTECLNYAVFWSAIGTWVTLDQALFVPKGAVIPNKAIEILLHARFPIVNLPKNVWQTLRECQVNNRLKIVTPVHVRKAIRDTNFRFDSYDVLCPVLEYVLSDINVNNITLLEGLDLIPLATNPFQTEKFSSRSDTLYVLNRTTLIVLKFLPGVESAFVSPSVFDSFIHKKLIEIAKSKTPFQLRLLIPSDVCKHLLPRSIKSWARQFRMNQQIQWQPSSAQHPSIEWIVILWHWLCENPNVLFETIGLPILPQQTLYENITNCVLLPFPNEKMSYFVAQHDDSGEDKVIILLGKLGAVTLRKNNFVFMHESISKFIQPATVPELVKFIVKNKCISNVIALADCEKNWLRELIAQYYFHNTLPSDYIPVIRKLPIFQVGVGATPASLSSLDSCKHILPPMETLFHPQLCYPKLLNNTERDVYKLINHSLQYKASEIDVVYLAIFDFAIREISKSQSWGNGDNLIIWVLTICPNLSKSLSGFLVNQRFVRTNFNQLKMPKELYNSQDKEFHRLFDIGKDDVFPCDNYIKYGLLNTLISLELKSWASLVNNIQALLIFLVDRAKSVEVLSSAIAFDRSCFIVELIGLYSQYNAGLMKAVKSIKFLKVQENPPSDFPRGLSWCGSNYTNKFESPEKICYYSGGTNDLIVGGVLPMQSCEYSQKLQINLSSIVVAQNFLSPTSEDVILQLHVLIDTVKKIPSSEINKVCVLVHNIYKFLNASTQSNFELPENWIWFNIEGKYQFVSEKNFFIYSPFDLTPFVYSASTELPQYGKLLKKSKIPQTLSCEDMIKVLFSIKQAVQAPLSERYINMVVGILNWLKKEKYESKGNVLIPTTDHTLCSPSECTYDDSGWNPVSKDTRGRSYLFVHPIVPPVVARHFGVESVSQKIAPSTKIGFKYKQIGPKERVTRRLRGIVNDYSGKIDFFKELIQNADDASATSIKFVLDYRQHGTNTLLNEQMKYCQGPALIAYNDSTFSDQDLENICELAAETKMSDPMKTGCFGVGFCACYSLTDVPSFISRRQLTIFDPHTKFLGDRVSISKPGMRMDLVEVKSDLEVYHDQFAPYNGLFGCNVFDLTGNGYEGTIFRFPIRMKGHPRSEISRDHYDLPQIKFMMNHLEKEAANLLLFLKHVKSLEAYVLNEKVVNASEMKLIFKVEKSCDKLSPRVKMLQLFKQNPELVQAPVCDKVSVVVHRKQQKDTICHYVLASALSFKTNELLKKGTNEILEMGLVPLAELAIKIDENNIPIIEKKSGLLFCFLPLPLESCLPFHVNGFFNVGKDRRGLKDAHESDEHAWNQVLIQQALPQAFVCALQKVAAAFNPSKLDGSRKESSLKNYYSLWPGTYGFFSNEFGGSWIAEEFSRCVKNPLLSCKGNLLWSEVNNGKWVTMSEACFFRNNQIPNEIEEDAINLLLKSLYNIVLCPKHVKKYLTTVKSNFIDYERFFKQVFIPNIGKIAKISSNKHLCFAMRECTKFHWVIDVLSNNKCIPVKGSGAFEYPRKLINVNSVFIAKLFDISEGRFTEDEFIVEPYVRVLVQLGMISGELPTNGLVERAQTVCRLQDKEKADNRVTDILEYLVHIDAKYFANERKTERMNSLSSVPFLRSKQNPFQGLVPWYSSDQRYFSPSDLFCDSHLSLIFNQLPVLCLPDRLKENYDNLLKSSLGISGKQPNLKTVLDNICSLIKKIKDGIQTNDPSLPKFLDDAFRDMYKFLNAECKSGNKQVIRMKLKDLPCIWLDRRLAFPSQVVCTWRSNQCYPYLCSLPSIYDEFEEFFLTIGVERFPSMKFLLKVISNLKNDYKDNPLSTEHIELVCSVSTKLAENYDIERDQESMLPDEKGILRHCSKLTCDDATIQKANWVQFTQAFKDFQDKGGHFMNPKIPRDTAQRLGARPILDAVLKNVEDMSFLKGTEFGQHEDLVDRLNGILKKYPPDTSIFKEFIQNSDDAKASEISFILDQRTNHPDKQLFLHHIDEWKKLQKVPALCIFNNKPFTEDDIEGICKLGRGGKGDTIDTIGRFGIGFNVAYHLTDCPMFVSFDGSGNPTNFCVFDPLRLYCVERHTSAPGRKWVNKDGYFDQFRDQFSPFLLDLFDSMRALRPTCFKDISQGFTVFRFPLVHWDPREHIGNERQPRDNYFNEANIHKVSQLKQLLVQLQSVSTDMLLFLNNIRHLSVFEVNETGKCAHYFSVEACTSNNSPMQATRPLSVSSETIVTKYESDNKFISKWIVNKQSGFVNNKFKAVSQVYTQAKERGLDAVGGTASMVNYRTILKGSMYCFLPVSIRSCLPVHLNGYFLLDDSRSHLGKILGIEDWNSVLVEHVVVPSYVNLVLKARDYVDGSIESIRWFYSLFPNLDSKEVSAASELKVNELFYDALLSCNHPVLIDQREVLKNKINWMHIDKGNFGLFCVSYPNNDQIIQASPQIRSILLSLGIPITCAPEYVFKGLCKTSQNYESSRVGLVTPEKATNFLRKNVLLKNKEIEKIILEKCEMLLEFCLQDCFNSSSIQARINGTPILKTKVNTLVNTGQLYSSQYSSLLPNHGSMFVNPSLESAPIGKKLLKGVIVWLPIQMVADYIALPSVNKPLKPTDDMKSLISSLWRYLSYHTTALDISSLFKDKPILPATTGEFYPAKLGKCIFSNSKDHMHVLSALKKLGYPKLDFNLISVKAPEYMTQLISVPGNAADIVSCMELLLPSLKGDLSKEEINDLLYIISHSRAIPICVCTSLRSLPLFETVFGTFCTGNSKFYIVPPGFPLDGLDVIRNALKTVFLKWPSDTQSRFCRKVIPKNEYDSAIYSNSRFYSEVVVPFFFLFSNPHIMIHLKKVNEIIASSAHNKTDEKKLLNVLKQTRLIRIGDKLYHVSDFYNPNNNFHAIFNSDKLLPEEWAKEMELLKFFFSLGLIDDVSFECWRNNALSVAEEGKKIGNSAPSKQLVDKSNALVVSLRTMLDKGVVTSEAFCKFLKCAAEINFIYHPSVISPLEMLLYRIIGWQPQASQFIKLESSVFCRSRNLVCFDHKALPKNFDFLSTLNYKSFWRYLSIVEPISPKKVILNLIKMSEIIASNSVSKVCAPSQERVNNVSKLKKIFEEHYNFLEENFFRDGDSYKLLLHRQCFLLSPDNVSLLMAEPNQLVMHMPKFVSFEPFCYKVPDGVTRYPRLLKALKIREQFETIDYIQILSSVKKEMKEMKINSLNSDTKLCRICSKAYELLVSDLRNDSNFKIPKDQVVVLPSIDGLLLEIPKLMYNDVPWMTDSLKQQKINFLLPPPPDNRGQTFPPKCLKVRFLSELAVEDLSDSVSDSCNRCAKQELYWIGKSSETCSIVRDLKITFKSQEFVQGFERLYWHENKTHPSSNLDFCKQLEKLTKLGSVRDKPCIYCVNNIRTVLKLNGRELSQNAINTNHTCYLKKKEENLSLYVNHKAVEASVEQFLEELATLLKETVLCFVRNELSIKAMLKCDPKYISQELDRLRISPFQASVQVSDGSMSVGTQISLTNIKFRKADLLFFCNFQEGEKVLYHCVVDKKPALKVGSVAYCGNQWSINTIVKLHIDSRNRKFINVTPLQVYKELTARDYATLVTPQKHSQYSSPLTLLPVPLKMQDLEKWLAEIIHKNSVKPYCLMTHLRQRLIAHFHYYFLTNINCPWLFFNSVKLLLELMKDENDIPCGAGDDPTTSINNRLSNLSIEDDTNGNDQSSDEDDISLLEFTSKQNPNPPPKITKVNISPTTPPTTSMPSLNIGTFRLSAPAPPLPRFSPISSRTVQSRYVHSASAVALPPPPTDLVKAKEWFLQAKVDFMAACDIFAIAANRTAGQLNLDFTVEELMEIDDCFYKRDDVESPETDGTESSVVIGSPKVSSDCKYPALVCFLCHDVVEKCIKGIMYAKCGLPNSLVECNVLSSLMTHLGKSGLCSKLIEVALQSSIIYVVEHDKRSRYPNYHYPTRAPASCYSVAEAMEALKIVNRLMIKLKDSDMKDLIGELNVLQESEIKTALAKCISKETG